tara:strand:- start:295 stop:1251 length:957 start_codon:yes stop_codon:yes gene_type:complete
MISFLRLFSVLVVFAMSAAMIAAFIHAYHAPERLGIYEYDWESYLMHLKWPAIILGSFVFLMATPLGDFIIGLFIPSRRQSLRDENTLSGLLQLLQEAYQEKFGYRISPKIQMLDLPMIEGIAYGGRTSAISSGLLKSASDEEIAAVLAHEIGHLHYRDGFYNILYLVAGIPFFICQYFLWFLIAGAFEAPEEGKGSNDDGAAGFIIMLIIVCVIGYYVPLFLALWLLGWPIIWMIKLLEVSIKWPQEYKADRFAAELGYGPALISLFERIEDEDVRGQYGFLSKYAYSHPPTALRIDKLERYLLCQSDGGESQSNSV